jgi:EAL domain-containing protein (putative c-di-GMP-specific phosphodiesterase class I)
MGRLLIVDDERAFAEFVAQVAASHEYAAKIACNAHDFLEALTVPPDVVMIDLQMPGADGIELLRELALRRLKAKILIVSGVDTRTIETARRLGSELGLDMGPGLHKPIRAAELGAHLRALAQTSWEPTFDSLENAIATDQLSLAFQPKVALATGKCVGVEALVRWRQPGETVIAPDMFIPFAEQVGLIDSLTLWVLRRAIGQAAEWRDQGIDLKLSVNASVANMHDPTLPDSVQSMCREAGLPPSQLVIELTETATMRDATRLMEVLARLRLKGVELSIDDFGTGYSSLVQLHRLPFTEIKIDKSFVINPSRESIAICRAITQLGHALELTVTAEGVESEDALAQLTAMGVDLAQGYLLSRPIPAADIPAFVRSRAV